jgi:glycogen debranching enzyme
MFDLTKVPFSRLGAYFSFGVNDWGPMGKALYLRVHYGQSPYVFKIDPMRDGKAIPYEILTSPSLLTLSPQGGGKVEFVIAGQDTVRVRCTDVSLRLEMPKERWIHTYAQPNNVWAFNMSPHAVQIALEPLQGNITMDAPLAKGKGFCFESQHMIATLSPDNTGQAEAAIDDFETTWIKPERPAFDTCLQEVQAEYAAWQEGLPDVSEEYTETRDLAAYVNWSAVVNSAGLITRPTMLMSKVGMCNVYNWDNVFNAMAHCTHQPDLAWDQLLVMADHQDQYGKSPSSLNRTSMRSTVTNSPIHGWGLKYMWDRNPSMITEKRMHAAYTYFSNWIDWITKYRTWPRDTLPYYHHGFDGGWDNSSIFDQGVPVITPDQPAYLILMMEVMSDLAMKLNRKDDAVMWQERADTMQQAFLQELWKEDHFIGLRKPLNEIVECESLLICMPMVLGKRLPKTVQQHLIMRIREHLTQHGLATEKLDSPNYMEGGYWRGPIWAPSTMLITHGLEVIGEQELANTLKNAFCKMCQQQGFYENFDPISGAGYFDTAYTWTSSVFLMFANQLHGANI